MKLKKNRAGMALISVLLLTVLLSMVTVSMVFISTNHAGMMGNAEQQMNALKAAEGMAEYALSQLNNDLDWSPTSSSPSLDFGKAKAYIYFTSASTEYLSYNNLKGKDPVTRSGNDRLAGQKVPAFTAELICKGTCGNAVKYLKVVYLRSDIYAYPIVSDGKIVMDGGNVKIYGDYTDPNDPGGGNIHSNWEDAASPSIEKSATCALDAKGGVASAAGKISGIPKNDPNITVKENLGSDGKLPVDEFNPDDIISKHSTDKAVSPGTYLISPLYYIPNDQAVMKQVLENARTNTTLNQDMKSYSLTKVPTPTTLAEAVSMGNVNTSDWKSTQGFNVNYNVAITTVEGVTYDAREGVVDASELGWDKIRVASITTTRTITVSGTEENTHGLWPFQWTSEDPTSGAGTTTEVINVEDGLLEFQLSPNNGSLYDPPDWLTGYVGGKKDKTKTPLLLSEPLGLAKLEGSEGNITTTAYLPIDVDAKKGTNYTSDELGLKTTATTTAGEKDTVDVSLGFELTDDIYISGTPGADDYKNSLDELVGTSKSPNITDNIFRIMGFSYEDKIGGKTYNLDTKFNLNDKNIYSGSHVVLGTEVSGKGSIISKGKIAYVYDGINSNEILSVSDDDLYIQTTEQGKYNVNGYLYSSDDVCIEDFNEAGALGGAVKPKKKGEFEKPEDMFIKGTVLGLNTNKEADGDANGNDSIKITGKRDKIFVHDSSGWRRLADLRKEGFSVRIGSWFELN
ncbi:MAG: hypothetical protein ABRQ39_05915 [Candidatus Eremiobacterota bacterium]